MGDKDLSPNPELLHSFFSELQLRGFCSQAVVFMVTTEKMQVRKALECLILFPFCLTFGTKKVIQQPRQLICDAIQRQFQSALLLRVIQ